MNSKYSDQFWSDASALITEHTTSKLTPYKQIALQLIEKHKLSESVDVVRKALESHFRRVNKRGEVDRKPVDLNTIAFQHPDLAKHCEETGLDVTKVSHFWHKSAHYSIFAKNGSEPKTDQILDVIEDIVKEYVSADNLYTPRKEQHNDKAIKIALSDLHVGMEPNKDGNALFQYVYNADVFNAQLEEVYQAAVDEYNIHGTFETCFICSYGDALDGYDGFTTRGGHKLEQNLGNLGQFSVYTRGMLRLIKNLIAAGIAKNYKVITVGNDNHAGTFAQIADTTIKMVLAETYSENVVSVRICKRFMEHFGYGEHMFIISHGKDIASLKHGLPLILNDKTYKYITSYIDHYKINAKYISVEKGDLHCRSTQKTKKFVYTNYMSFAPPSSWAMTNFSDGSVSGFSLQIIPKYSSKIRHIDHYFELETVEQEFM